MNDVVCRSGVELLTEYMEDTLTADVRAAIETHVAGCPRCVAFMASWQDSVRIMREATTAEMPSDLEASLLAAVRRAQGGTR